MPRLLTTLTRQGAIKSTQAGLDLEHIDGTGACTIGALMPDARSPYMWYFDETSGKVWAVDIYDSRIISGRTITGVYKPRAIQADSLTGSVYVLQPYSYIVPVIESSSSETSPANYSAIFVCDKTTASKRELALYLDKATEPIFLAMDMKIDAARRRLWIADTGNNRVLRVDLDSQQIRRIYSPDGMTCPSTLTFDVTTGNAFVRAYDRPNGNEKIYILDDIGVAGTLTVGADFAWSTTPWFDWLEPSFTMLELVILTGSAIPFPHSASMSFDHFRNNLWWLSGKGNSDIYLYNTDNQSGTSCDMGSWFHNLSACDARLDDGSLFVAGWKHSASGFVVAVDKSCSLPPTIVMILPTEIRQTVLVQWSNGALPSFWRGVTSVAEAPGSSSSSSHHDVSSVSSMSSSSSSSSSSLGEIKHDMIASPPFDGDAYIPNDSDTLVNWVDAYVWADDVSGISSFRVGAVPGMPYEEFRKPEATIKLPRFSWSSRAYGTKSIFVATTASNNVVEVEYDPISGKMQTIGKVADPLGEEIVGLSVSPDSNKVYVSGYGYVAKIEIVDSASGGSSSEEGGFVLVGRSQQTNIDDMSVQRHNKQDIIWGASRSRGTVIRISDFDQALLEEQGTMMSPIKLVWSEFHQKLIVGSEKSLHTVAEDLSQPQIFDALSTYSLQDMDVSPDGHIALVAKDDGSISSLLRVLKGDLFEIQYGTESSDMNMSRVVFGPTGKVFVSLESISKTGQVVSTFEMIDYNAGSVQPFVGGTSGSVVSLVYDQASTSVFAFMSSGKVVKIYGSGGLADYSIGETPTIVKSGLTATVSRNDAQSKVRIWVGSKPGLNDRWDSGEVSTTKRAMVYGGGNNLEPGMKYWAHISVYTVDKGWSETQVRNFVVPRT